MVMVGRRTFFAFRRTKHINTCKKPVFLDFGSVLVEVERFSDAVAHMHGFGRTRSREWFAVQFLSDRLRHRIAPQSYRCSGQCRWHKYKRYGKTEDARQWNNPETNTHHHPERIKFHSTGLVLPADRNAMRQRMGKSYR